MAFALINVAVSSTGLDYYYSEYGFLLKQSKEGIGIFRSPETIILSCLWNKWVVSAEQNQPFSAFFNVLFVRCGLGDMVNVHACGFEIWRRDGL